MRRIVLSALALCFAGMLFAQTDTTIKIKTKSYIPSRANDHFLIQIGGTQWLNKPDSIHTTGFSRSFNFYLMLDFPFKTNPHLSVAIGPGIASDNIFFDKTYVGLKENSTTLRFQNLSDTSHFKKYKLNTTFLEAPVELRYRFNPANDNKSVKIALGVKVGYLINAHTKGKDWVDKNGTAIYNYTDKETNNRFINTTRLSGSARLGYGHFSIFANYALTPLFKEGVGPQVHPLSIGLTLSGL